MGVFRIPRKYYTQGIYIITNLVDGKVYIGQSLKIERRLDCHKSNLRGKYHSNKHLQRAYNLHGADNFKFDILEHCTVDKIDDREKYWIEYYKSTNQECGYNIENGGNLLKTLPEETRKKISSSKKGKRIGPCSEETKRKISESNMGNTAWLGKNHSEDSKRKISESKRYNPSQEMIDDVKSGFSLKQFYDKYGSDTFHGKRIWDRIRKECGLSRTRKTKEVI